MGKLYNSKSLSQKMWRNGTSGGLVVRLLDYFKHNGFPISIDEGHLKRADGKDRINMEGYCA
jgi:hypothetical protein